MINVIIKIKWNYLYFIFNWHKNQFMLINFKIFLKKYFTEHKSFTLTKFLFFEKNNIFKKLNFNLIEENLNEFENNYSYTFNFNYFKFLN